MCKWAICLGGAPDRYGRVYPQGFDIAALGARMARCKPARGLTAPVRVRYGVTALWVSPPPLDGNTALRNLALRAERWLWGTPHPCTPAVLQRPRVFRALYAWRFFPRSLRRWRGDAPSWGVSGFFPRVSPAPGEKTGFSVPTLPGEGANAPGYRLPPSLIRADRLHFPQGSPEYAPPPQVSRLAE